MEALARLDNVEILAADQGWALDREIAALIKAKGGRVEVLKILKDGHVLIQHWTDHLRSPAVRLVHPRDLMRL